MKTSGVGRWSATALIVIAAAAVVTPMLWVAVGSLRQPDGRWGLAAYGRAWTQGGLGEPLLLSAVLTVATTASVVLLGALAAHAIVRFQSSFSERLHWLFLIGMVVPAQLAVVPLFFQMRALGLLGEPIGLWLVYTANGLPFAVFVLTPFLRQVPSALLEAARIDGCGEAGLFFRVVLPLARPGLATVAIFQAIGVWKEYFHAFMLLSGSGADASRTLPLALGNLAVASLYQGDRELVFAGIMIVALPVLVAYLLLQRSIVEGLASGGVKG